MQLRLAEYKDGKFERFLELGRDFGYFGNFILVSNDFSRNFEEEYTPISESEQDGSCGPIPSSVVRVLKDEKDPLNRFGGLFDGRTYGDGRFVLLRGGKYDFEDYLYEDPSYSHRRISLLKWGEEGAFVDQNSGEYFSSPSCDISIHEYPELYDASHNNRLTTDTLNDAECLSHCHSLDFARSKEIVDRVKRG